MGSKSKMDIPQDWSNLSDEKVLEYIAYLKKHCGKYKIAMDENKVIHVGEVANVWFGVKDLVSVVEINNKYFYCKDNESPYDNAYELYRKLKDRLVPFKTKAKEWWGNNRQDVFCLVGAMVLLGGLVFLGKKAYEQDKHEKEQFKQEIINEALKQFRQEQKTLHLQQKVK